MCASYGLNAGVVLIWYDSVPCFSKVPFEKKCTTRKSTVWHCRACGETNYFLHPILRHEISPKHQRVSNIQISITLERSQSAKKPFAVLGLLSSEPRNKCQSLNHECPRHISCHYFKAHPIALSYTIQTLFSPCHDNLLSSIFNKTPFAKG